MKRTVMLIWKGQAWSWHEIETRTALTDDLPPTLQAVTNDSQCARFNFVLAGRCGDAPLYLQI